MSLKAGSEKYGFEKRKTLKNSWRHFSSRYGHVSVDGAKASLSCVRTEMASLSLGGLAVTQPISGAQPWSDRRTKSCTRIHRGDRRLMQEHLTAWRTPSAAVTRALELQGERVFSQRVSRLGDRQGEKHSGHCPDSGGARPAGPQDGQEWSTSVLLGWL